MKQERKFSFLYRVFSYLSAPLLRRCFFMLFILFPRRHAAADVPLGLIQVQQLSHLRIHLRLEPGQPLGQILVHRGLGYAKLSCRLTDGALLFNYVLSQIADPLFYIRVHFSPLPACGALPQFDLLNLYADVGADMKSPY